MRWKEALCRGYRLAHGECALSTYAYVDSGRCDATTWVLTVRCDARIDKFGKLREENEDLLLRQGQIYEREVQSVADG